MERLWAPWRIDYVQQQQPPGCIFCSKPKGDDAEELIVARGMLCFALLNAFPYTNGHSMVAPYEHTGCLEELSGEQGAELFLLTQRLVAALRSSVQPDGFNIGFNLGRAAGAGIEDHLHLHIVPRWHGDTSFMPVLSDTRVIPQGLRETYEAIRAQLAD